MLIRTCTTNMIGKKRHIESRLSNLLNLFPVVAIVGARQVGKTTLSKLIAPDWKYFDLENPHDFDRIKHDPAFFFKQNSSNIILDEAQEFPEIFKVLIGVIDQNRDQKGRFIITGSSSPQLLSSISESLAGRVATVELGTLKTTELHDQQISNFYNIFTQKISKTVIDDCIKNTYSNLSNNDIENSWLYGGYPEPVLNQEAKFFIEWMDQYRDTYINRDIAKLFPKLNKYNYQRFVMMMSKLSGTILNKSDIARALEVSEKTIRDYVNILTDTFIWRSIPSYENNILKSIIKMPKGNIRDSGLLHFLLGIHEIEDLYNNSIVGYSFEGFVVEEVIKGLQSKMVSNWSCNYYRTRNGAEIDLILSGPFGIVPIEIKYGVYTPIKNLKTLSNFVQEHDLPFGLLINNAENIDWITKNILQVPARFI